ncbi:MAG: hypothetical protein WBZ36_15435 [Candidatus Nitrosopolaris sp.]
MSNDPLLSSIIPFAGSGLLGYAMGFALKKVLKWANHHRFLGWDILCRCSTAAKVRLCEHG